MEKYDFKAYVAEYLKLLESFLHLDLYQLYEVEQTLMNVYEEGFQHGQKTRSESDFDKGFKEGFENGETEHEFDYEDGRKKGYKEGFEDGLKEPRKEN